MEMNQIAPFVNSVTEEILGETGVVSEDLSNIVDVGTAIFNANAFDHYVRKLINQVGRMKFVNRPYSGRVPSVLMESWEYGSIMEKISSWSITTGSLPRRSSISTSRIREALTSPLIS